MTFKYILGLLFVLLTALISVVAWISYRNNEESVRTAELVKHTQHVIDLAEAISAFSKDIQLESNAYFVSHDSSFVAPYRYARATTFDRLDQLELLTEDRIQQSRVDQLNNTLEQLVKFTDTAFEAEPSDYSGMSLADRVETNMKYRNTIRGYLHLIKVNAEQMLIQHERDNSNSIAAFRKTFFFLLASIAALLVVTFVTVRHHFNQRLVAERKVQSANELFEKLFYESPVGVMMSSLEYGNILNCNAAFAALVNCNREVMLTQKIPLRSIFVDPDKSDEIVAEAIRHGVARDVDVELKSKDRGPLWASLSMQSIKVGERNCLLSSAVDMTAHKKAEEEMKNALASEMELNKLKSNFITLASHEFRTPLTTILSSAFLLENMAMNDGERTKKHLARIKSSVSNLTSILDEFLSLTKIEEGRVEPNLEQIDIKSYIEIACQNLQTFAKPGQRIVYRHDGDQQVVTDPVLLGNILNNLVSNAIKYSDDNTVIYVSTFVNSKMHLNVRDEGIGIPSDELVKLFHRFYRASNAGAVQGTGLGLHIMKHYVDMLHGSVQVKSEIGKGSEFEVVFESSHVQVSEQQLHYGSIG